MPRPFLRFLPENVFLVVNVFFKSCNYVESMKERRFL